MREQSDFKVDIKVFEHFGDIFLLAESFRDVGIQGDRAMCNLNELMRTQHKVILLMIEAFVFLLLDDVFELWHLIEVVGGDVDFLVVELQHKVFSGLGDIFLQLVHSHIVQFVGLLNVNGLLADVTVLVQDD